MKMNEMYPSKWLRAQDVSEPTVATIRDFEMTRFQSDEGEQVKPALFFEECSAGFILNKTNATMIAAILKSDDTDNWIGKKIGLRSEMVPFKGKPVPSIRVFDPTPPKAFGKAPDAASDNVPDTWGPNGQPLGEDGAVPDPGLPISMMKKKSKSQAELI